MGAYLMYKLVNPKDTDRANRWLEQQKEQQVLRKLGYHNLWFWSRKDREIELEKVRTKGYGSPDYRKIGEGDFKASDLYGDEEEKVFPLVAILFKKLHENFKVKVYSGSCALLNGYFTAEQLRMITNDGKALSGKYKEAVIKEMGIKTTKTLNRAFALR